MSELLGLPYVGWSPRPSKNGQPPPCNLPRCNSTFAGRKVGNALKRLPNIQLGHKVKEEILQKWDPVSRSMVTIHAYKPAIVTSSNIQLVGTTLTVSWTIHKSNATTRDSVYVQLFHRPIEGDDVLVDQIETNTGVYTFNAVPGYSYYASITPNAGISTITPTVYLTPFISATLTKIDSTRLEATWVTVAPVDVTFRLLRDTNGNGLFLPPFGVTRIPAGTTSRTLSGLDFSGNTQYRFTVLVDNEGVGSITSNAINP